MGSVYNSKCNYATEKGGLDKATKFTADNDYMEVGLRLMRNLAISCIFSFMFITILESYFSHNPQFFLIKFFEDAILGPNENELENIFLDSLPADILLISTICTVRTALLKAETLIHSYFVENGIDMAPS